MGRLNFEFIREITPKTDLSAIVNVPGDDVHQIYLLEGTLKKQKAHLTYTKNYPALSFGAAATLAYDNVVDFSLKSFPDFGNYGVVTQEQNGSRFSTIFKKI